MMRVRIYPHAVERLKQSSRRFLPDIKNSHRIEAFARGLRYNSYASLTFDLKANHEVVRTLDGKRFTAFIREKYPHLPAERGPEVFLLIVGHACLQVVDAEGGAE